RPGVGPRAPEGHPAPEIERGGPFDPPRSITPRSALRAPTSLPFRPEPPPSQAPPPPRQLSERTTYSLPGRPDPTRLVVPPRLRRERPLPRPDLVERIGVVEPAVLHDVPDPRAVADILERIRIEHEDVGELARLEGAEVLAEPDRLRAEDRGRAQHIVVREPTGRHGPELPVI